VEIFDPETNAWTAATPMRTALYNHSQSTLAAGWVLVCGGTHVRKDTRAHTDNTHKHTLLPPPPPPPTRFSRSFVHPSAVNVRTSLLSLKQTAARIKHTDHQMD